MLKDEVILQPKTWEKIDNKVFLKPTHCPSCSEYFFPPLKGCPLCFSQDLDQISVDSIGELYSYSTICVPRKGYPNPYSVALVDFPNINMRVFGTMTENGPFSLGAKVKIVDGIICERGNNDIRSFMFQLEKEE